MRATVASSPAGERRQEAAGLLAQLAAVAAQFDDEEAAEEADEEAVELAGKGLMGAAAAAWARMLPLCLLLSHRIDKLSVPPSPHFPEESLAAHAEEHHATLMELHGRNRRRIAKQGGKGGASFAVGEAVLLKPPKMGKVGSTIDATRIVCRVVEVVESTGKYKLRCNSGLIHGTYGGGEALRLAPFAAAAMLTFPANASCDGVPAIGLTAAVNKELRRQGDAPAPQGRRRRV